MTNIQNYEDRFLKENDWVSSRDGKAVKITPQTHRLIMRLLAGCEEKNLNMSTFIDNVLRDHFRIFHSEVQNIVDRGFDRALKIFEKVL